MRDFRKLIVWQKSHPLGIALHTTAEEIDWRRAPGLRGQLLRASSSVPANIAEGCGKRSAAELVRYLDIALGSARELESHLLFARDVGCLSAVEYEQLSAAGDEVRRLLYALGRAVRSRSES